MGSSGVSLHLTLCAFLVGISSGSVAKHAAAPSNINSQVHVYCKYLQYLAGAIYMHS